ncbi:MAG: tetratricopeptide repeat protein [Bacteroidota bacterium]
MKSERLTKLFEFLEDEPENPFNLYAIGVEYLNHDSLKSLNYFEKVLAEHPDYLPVYYQAALLYVELENDDKAEETFLKGVKLAQNKGEQLTERELKSAYDEFKFE